MIPNKVKTLMDVNYIQNKYMDDNDAVIQLTSYFNENLKDYLSSINIEILEISDSIDVDDFGVSVHIIYVDFIDNGAKMELVAHEFVNYCLDISKTSQYTINNIINV